MGDILAKYLGFQQIHLSITMDQARWIDVEEGFRDQTKITGVEPAALNGVKKVKWKHKCAMLIPVLIWMIPEVEMNLISIKVNQKDEVKALQRNQELVPENVHQFDSTLQLAVTMMADNDNVKDRETNQVISKEKLKIQEE